MNALPAGGGIGGTGIPLTEQDLARRIADGDDVRPCSPEDFYGVTRRADLDPALPLDTPDDPECLRGLTRWTKEGGWVVLLIAALVLVQALRATARFAGG